MWRDAIAELRADFRCITLDLPGAGLGDGDRQVIDLGVYTTVVNSLLDRRDIAHAVLVI